MTCTGLELLLCDYVDGTLDAARRVTVERHLADCPACAELARDSAAAVDFLARVEAVQPPAELVTRILFQIPTRRPSEGSRSGIGQRIRSWFEPILQPRLAMGMAMTILSFAMLGRFAGIQPRQLTAADLNPVRVWATLDDRCHRSWERAVKYYENLRFVYEIQSRLKELTEQEDVERKAQPPAREPAAKQNPNAAAGESTGRENQ
ncbi:MAG: zf-HC2 domain-containing protein [Acidobacteria bacterium]|nr:zf-HC2 domain-containing protein [Acidobacteriota bacterium]